MFVVLACLFTHAGCLQCESAASRYSGLGSSFSGLCWSYGGASTTSPGPAVHVALGSGGTSTDTYFENCRFYDMSTESQAGGAVYLYGAGTHEFHFCEFKNVKSGDKGGAFYAGDVWNVVVHACIFDHAQGVKSGAFYVALKGGKFFYVSHSQFLDCIGLEDEYDGEVYRYDGGLWKVEGPTGSAVDGLLANCTFENCTVSYSEPVTLLSCIYLDLKTTEMPVTFQACVFNTADLTFEEYFFKVYSCENVLLNGCSFDSVKITGSAPLLKPAYDP